MKIRKSAGNDTQAVRALRLFALQNAPEAFAMDHALELLTPPQTWLERCTPTTTATIFVAEDEDASLVGTAGISSNGRLKTGHIGWIWGVFVHPDARGKGHATALVKACLNWAVERELARVNLGVATTNTAAVRLYTRCGFSTYGIEPDAIRVEGKSYDEFLMQCRL